MTLRLIEAPTEPVLSLDEVKAHLRVDDGDHDDLLLALIAAATERLDGADGILGRCLAPQTWELLLPAFPAARWQQIKLPLPPTIAVPSVEYVDASGAVQTFEDYVLTVARNSAWITPALGATWPMPARQALDAVRVRFIGGYTAGSPPVLTVPATIKQAMQLMVAHWYDAGEPAGLPASADALLAPYRIVRP